MGGPLKCVLFVLVFFWSITAQAQQGSLVVVKMDSLSVVYSQNGTPLSPTFLIDSVNDDNAGYYDDCGGYVQLNSTVDSGATLIFNGTSISVELLLASSAGDVNLYLDGVLWETFHGYSHIAGVCQSQMVTNINLSQQSHNVTVVNATPLNYTFIGGFNYTSFSDVTAAGTLTLVSGTRSSTTATSTSTASASHHSVGPIIGGVIGGVAVLIIIILVASFMMRRRRRRSQDTIVHGHGPAGLATPTMPRAEESKFGRPPPPDTSSVPYAYSPLISQSLNTVPYTETVTSAPQSESSRTAPTMSYASSTPFTVSNMGEVLIAEDDNRRASTTTSSYPSKAQPHPSFLRPLPDAPSPPYTSPISTRASSDLRDQHTADLSQVDLIQQLVSRGVPTHEVVRMMGEVGSSGSAGIPTDDSIVDGLIPPPNYGDSKRG
ncbi:hypothetical protein FRB98_007723 [Tulasnella sp. 332]|nr:hypothetical protein FRB98_007723 [Tulasnella sp. 332]